MGTGLACGWLIARVMFLTCSGFRDMRSGKLESCASRCHLQSLVPELQGVDSRVSFVFACLSSADGGHAVCRKVPESGTHREVGGARLQIAAGLLRAGRHQGSLCGTPDKAGPERGAFSQWRAASVQC